MSASYPRTIPRLFEDSVQKFSEKIMMWEKRGDAYKGSTYREIQESVHQCAAGLISLGLEKGDRLGLISEGRNDWVIAELGILYTGAINVPLSVKLEERSDLKFRLAHSGCRMVVVSGNQAQKVMKMRVDLPDLEKIILLDPQGQLAEDEIGFPELLSRGKEYLKRHRSDLERRWQSIQEHDPATISYTSGTTADPKGVTLTHRNYTANVKQCSDHLPQPEWYCSLIIIPWDHSFGHTAGIYLLTSIGASMASIQSGKTALETLRNIPTNIKEIKPTFLLSVPALAKNFRKNIEKGISEKGKLVWNLYRKGLEIAYAHYGDGYNGGKDVGKPIHPLYTLCETLIFRKIRASFGGRLDYFVGGAAHLDVELQRFFNAIGLPMYQGYGLSEAAPVVSCDTPTKHKFGSSGTVLPRIDVKICDDQGNALPVGQKGEIVVRGENVMAGYWNNERATRETLRDEWLFTGDIGYLDADGFLFVLGREKSVLIGHDGEKYSPEGIEETIVAHSPFIEQVMLYNNQSSYTVGLIVPNKEAVLGYLKHKHLSCHTDEGQTAALRLLESEINRYREGNKSAGMFPERWLPAAVAVLGEGFTEQNRLMNSTMKIVRGRISEFYQNRIEYALTPEGKDFCNHQNKNIVKRFEEGKK
ncbi:MAG: AMP-binding protein [Ignavibacteriales bacterium]|nr:AMP-binding protein [Ignavibacteriales bacterium]